MIPCRCPRASGDLFLASTSLSGGGCSVLIVDGGRGEGRTSGQQPPRDAAAEPSRPSDPTSDGGSDASSNLGSRASSDGGLGGGVESVLAVAARARAAREAGDADALAADRFLAEALDRVHAVISDLDDTRWSTRAP